MSTNTPNCIAKNLKSINVALADEDLQSLDNRRGKIKPFKPSRSEFGRIALRFTLASLMAGQVSMESLAQKFANAPVIDDGD